MAHGHEDFLGYAEIQGEHESVPTPVAFTADGDIEIVWVD